MCSGRKWGIRDSYCYIRKFTLLVKISFSSVIIVFIHYVAHEGFEKMERGLSEKFTDKTSPIKNHTDTLTVLGADSKPLHNINTVTSDIIKVWPVELH